MPVGPFVVDGSMPGTWTRALRGQRRTAWPATRPRQPAATDTGSARPFAGLRIVDLGMIVAGGELGRLFGDLGAEVIKVESAAYPDGLRQTPPGR